jgi:hypothetical protein
LASVFSLLRSSTRQTPQKVGLFQRSPPVPTISVPRI